MPHSPADKKKALTRVRRIKGQAEALERALESGADCAPVLQQLAALRGAVNGLMAEVMEALAGMEERSNLIGKRFRYVEVRSIHIVAAVP